MTITRYQMATQKLKSMINQVFYGTIPSQSFTSRKPIDLACYNTCSPGLTGGYKISMKPLKKTPMFTVNTIPIPNR